MAERVGLVKPAVDAHTLGINSLAELLRDCGYEVVLGPAEVAAALDDIKYQAQRRKVVDWVTAENLTRLGVSYRLDPGQAAALVGFLLHELLNNKLLAHQGGPLRGFYFAGLPEACGRIDQEYHGLVKTFSGGETAAQTLAKFEVPPEKIPPELQEGQRYDEQRLTLGAEIIAAGRYLAEKPAPIRRYRELGSREDSLEKRLGAVNFGAVRPLMRAHAGPYSSVREFLDWVQRLAHTGLLDILSIGTSQLTQGNFGEDWADLPNGGGVPINSAAEYEQIWANSRPLLLRTYAGTKNVPELAAIHEETINICWHALSFWWFNRLDGRGPNGLLENLRQHVQTTAYIARTGKPLEANVSHHFAFRGGDDVTYIVSAYLAAKLAKKMGIRTFVLQNMLNTPRQTWGLQDLAKSRALLSLVKSLEDQSFRVLLQPRAGLDYFSADEERAKAQLAAVTALMDDIEPRSEQSPPLIHVVGFSEGSRLATPDVIDESIRITSYTLRKYRELRRKGLVDDLSENPEVHERAAGLIRDARIVIGAIEEHIAEPYSAEGFFKIFVSGFLPVPYLWNREEVFEQARSWATKLVRGGVVVVDDLGQPIKTEARVEAALSRLGDARYALTHQHKAGD